MSKHVKVYGTWQNIKLGYQWCAKINLAYWKTNGTSIELFPNSLGINIMRKGYYIKHYTHFSQEVFVKSILQEKDRQWSKR